MFVLILTSHVYMGTAIATVPGYSTIAACQKAGEQWAETSSWVSSGKNFKCIPGPLWIDANGNPVKVKE